MKRFYCFTGSVVAILLLLSLNASAALISGGVSDAGLIDRGGYDVGAGVNFINLSSPINGDGWLTSWSIYAQHTGSVKLIIFRSNGTDYDVVGKSPLETITTLGKQTFTDLGSSGMAVKLGDYLGWYNPSLYGPISMNGGGDDVHWKYSAEAETPWMYAAGEGRTYSINVSGSTDPVPLPSTLMLLGSGLLGLAGLRRKLKRS